ncbi:helix-turn-helix domain-containing protein [Catellatospora tritici]|uniref:helix-turn-helix domain-containing protein n=1 Tax=Catellatospora tritici TaxID=2851566 RepID=UPI001C2D89F0|nr:helix-turn-helix domain-containing protein [Catellatospora tritici]MBV1851906.1 helix-turn-helix domain-containing protein [Catellatospora tritici]
MSVAATSTQSKLLLTADEAAAVLGIGRTLLYDLVRTGKVRSVQIGRLRRFRPADLRVYADQLADANNN